MIATVILFADCKAAAMDIINYRQSVNNANTLDHNHATSQGTDECKGVRTESMEELIEEVRQSRDEARQSYNILSQKIDSLKQERASTRTRDTLKALIHGCVNIRVVNGDCLAVIEARGPKIKPSQELQRLLKSKNDKNAQNFELRDYYNQYLDTKTLYAIREELKNQNPHRTNWVDGLTFSDTRTALLWVSNDLIEKALCPSGKSFLRTVSIWKRLHTEALSYP